MLKIILCFLIVSVSYGATSDDILIRGKIGHSFDEKSVSVIDSFGQKYRIPRKLFPASFNFSQGKSFYLEISEKEVSKLKIKTP